MREGGLGQAVEAEHPHLPVDADRLLPENLGQPAGAVAPHRLHLEQAVLGMRETEAERGVRVIGGGDQRDPVGIARDRHRRAEPGDRDPALDLRQ